MKKRLRFSRTQLDKAKEQRHDVFSDAPFEIEQHMQAMKM